MVYETLSAFRCVLHYIMQSKGKAFDVEANDPSEMMLLMAIASSVGSSKQYEKGCYGNLFLVLTPMFSAF